MSEERPISLEELRNRITIDGTPQLEDGILIKVPRGWFESLQRQVDQAQTPLPAEPERPTR